MPSDLHLDPHLRRQMTPLQLQLLTEAELSERLIYIKASITKINVQQQKNNQAGGDRPPHWKHAAEGAKRAFMAELSAAKMEAARRSRPVQPGEAKDRSHAFIQAAKAMLSKDQVADIWSLAVARDPQAFPDHAREQPHAH